MSMRHFKQSEFKLAQAMEGRPMDSSLHHSSTAPSLQTRLYTAGVFIHCSANPNTPNSDILNGKRMEEDYLPQGLHQDSYDACQHVRGTIKHVSYTVCLSFSNLAITFMWKLMNSSSWIYWGQGHFNWSTCVGRRGPHSGFIFLKIQCHMQTAIVKSHWLRSHVNWIAVYFYSTLTQARLPFMVQPMHLHLLWRSQLHLSPANAGLVK